MPHNEELTRGAARAIGLDVSEMEWVEKYSELRGLNADGFPVEFSPLRRARDAYTVEDKLLISVTYKMHGPGKMTLHVSALECGGAVMHSVKPHEDRLAARMYAITQYAALYALMMKDEEVAHA